MCDECDACVMCLITIGSNSGVGVEVEADAFSTLMCLMCSIVCVFDCV